MTAVCTTPVPSVVVTKPAEYTLCDFSLRRDGIGKSCWYDKPTKSFPAKGSDAIPSKSFRTAGTRSLARIYVSFTPLGCTRTYLMSSPTARATLPGNVQGVVVQE